MDPQHPFLLSYALPALLILLVLTLRLRRMRTAQRLRLERLWIIPAFYGAITVFVLLSTPPHGEIGWAIVTAAFAIGAVVGWQRGRTVHIGIDPETHQLNQRASPATLIFLIALIAIRAGLRSASFAEGAAWHLDAALITDAFVAMAAGLITLTRLEMYLRARRLLAAEA